MKKEQGITLMVMVITIIVLLIIASISVNSGSKSINRSKLENLKTNMLLVKAKTKEYVENANFKLGTNPSSLTEEQKNTALSELKGTNITDFTKLNSIGVTKETGYIYYYELSKEDLSAMGLNSIKLSEGESYIIKYDLENVKTEVYNTNGFKDNNGNSKYSLTDIQNIEI